MKIMEFITRWCFVVAYLTFLCISCHSQQSAKSLWSPSPNYFYHHENHRYDNWDNYYNYYNSFGSRTTGKSKSSSTTTPRSSIAAGNKSRENSGQPVLKEKASSNNKGTNVTVEIISRRTGKSFYTNVRSAGFAKWKHVCCTVLKHFRTTTNKFRKVRRLCRRFKCYRDYVQDEQKIVTSVSSTKPESFSSFKSSSKPKTHTTPGPVEYYVANGGNSQPSQHHGSENAYWSDWHDPTNENGEADGWKPGTGMQLDGWKQEKEEHSDDGWKPGTGMEINDGWKPGTGMELDDGWKPGTGMELDDGWKPGTGIDYEGWKPVGGKEIELHESRIKTQMDDNMLAVSFTLVLSMIAIVTGIFLFLGVLNGGKVIKGSLSHKKIGGSGEVTTSHPPTPKDQALELIQHIHVHLQSKHGHEETNEHEKEKDSKEHDEKQESNEESNKHESNEESIKHESNEESIKHDSVEQYTNHEINSNSNSNEDDESEGIQEYRPQWKNPLPKKPKPWRRPKRPLRKRPQQIVTAHKVEEDIIPTVPKDDKIVTSTAELNSPVVPEVVSAVTGGKERGDLEKKELTKEVLGLTAESMHTAAYSLLLVNVLGELLEDALKGGEGDEGSPGGKVVPHVDDKTPSLKNGTLVGIAKNYTLISAVPENIENRTLIVPVLAEKSENKTVIPLVISSSKLGQPIHALSPRPHLVNTTIPEISVLPSENPNNQTTSPNLPANLKAQNDVAVPAPVVVQNTRNNFFSRHPVTTTRRSTTSSSTSAPTTTTTTVMPKDAVAGLFYKKVGSEIWPMRHGYNAESQTWTGYAPTLMKKKQMSSSIEITAFGS